MNILKAVVAMTLAKWLFPSMLLAVTPACGPTLTNPPPPENPVIDVAMSILGSSWDPAYHEHTISVVARNDGNVVLTSIEMPDSARIAAYIPSPATSAVTTAPTLISGPAGFTANASWTGLAAEANLLDASGTLGVGETLQIVFVLRITHNGTPGTYTGRAWASGTSPLSTVVTDQHGITLTPPAAPETPTIGIAKYFGATTGTAPNFSVPCTLIVKNLGNVTINRIDVRDPVANAFVGISGASLTSITSKASKRFTFKASFDGTTDHDSLLSVLVADSLRIAGTGTASTDTLTFTINFDAGTGTSFSNSATAAAANLANPLTTSDVSDWGVNPDPSGNGNPSDPGEDTPSQFSIPVSGTATSTVVISAAGNWVGYVPFAEDALPVTTLTSGNGIVMTDTLAASFSTQYLDPVLLAEGGDGIVAKWPTTPASVRLARLAFKPTHVGTYTVTLPGSPQSADSVDTSTDPGFEVVLNGATYTFTRSDFGTVGAGRIYRTGIATKEATPADGLTTYGGNPGTIAVMMEYRWYKDGTYRALVGIRNRRCFEGQRSCGTCTGCATTFGAASDYTPVDVCTGITSPSLLDADWTINRRSGRAMRLRWAADYALGSGADTSTVHLWHPGSYTHPTGGSYGGKLRAGEDFWVEVTDQSSTNPPEGWYSGDYYKLTAALHDTDNLALFTGPAYNSADSLKWRWEAQARGWVEGVNDENPIRPDWMNIRDAGGQVRKFDGGDAISGMMEGNDQYRTDYNTLKLALAASRATNDTMLAHPNFTSVAWKMFEQGARKHAQACYNVQYNFTGRDYAFAWGTMWPHTQHSSNDVDRSGRSAQTPSGSYLLQGDGTLGLWNMTGWNAYRQTYLRLVANRVYYATNTQYRTSVVNGGEQRSTAGVVMWLALHYDMTGLTTYRDLALNIVRDDMALEDFGQDPCPPAGTTWNGDKPWMWQLFACELRQFARILDRYGDTAEALEMRGYIAEWQTIFAAHGTYPMTYDGQQFADGYPGANYPLCTSTSTPAFTMSYYGWGSSDCGPICCEDDGFWSSIAGSVMSDYGSDPNLWRDLWRSGVAYVGSGTNYLCPGEYEDEYQKFGIPAHWSWDALRQYEGTLDQRPQGDGPTYTEELWDD